MVGIGFGVAQALGTAGRFASGLMSARARRGEFNEALRQLELRRTQTVGLARAKAAASGTEMSSLSTVEYLAALTKEFDIARTNLRRTRDLTGRADLIGNLSGLLGGASSIYGGLGQANNWDWS